MTGSRMGFPCQGFLGSWFGIYPVDHFDRRGQIAGVDPPSSQLLSEGSRKSAARRMGMREAGVDRGKHCGDQHG